jgi:hypothetical protein
MSTWPYELSEETGLTLTVDDLTLLSSNHVRAVPLRAGKHEVVYDFAASVPVRYVNTNLRTPTKVEQAANAHSTIHYDGTYVVPSTIDIDGLTLTPSKTWILKETQPKFKTVHFSYVAQWEAFRGAVISKHVLAHDDASLPRHLFFFIRFLVADSGHAWVLIKGYINQLCRATPIDVRMGVPAPTTNFVGWEVTLIEAQRKAAINAPDQSRQDASWRTGWR